MTIIENVCDNKQPGHRYDSTLDILLQGLQFGTSIKDQNKDNFCGGLIRVFEEAEDEQVVKWIICQCVYFRHVKNII